MSQEQALDILKRTGLVVASGGGVACMECQQAYDGKDAASHVKHRHLGPLTRSYVDKIEEAFKASGATNLPQPPITTAGVPQRRELLAHSGLCCSTCGHCLSGKSAEKRMRVHVSQMHPNQPGRGYSQCLVQRFNDIGGPQKTYFRVVPFSDKDESDFEDARGKALVEHFQLALRRTLPAPSVPTDSRMVTPWLLSTRWHEKTSGLDPAVVSDWVKVPSDEPFAKLRDGYTDYLKAAIDFISCTEDLVLQRLHTDDPDKT